MFAGAVLAAAVAFCAGAPDEPRCSNAPVTEIALTEAHRATIERLAGQIRLGARYQSEGTTDTWTAAGPRAPGDCEDRLLWASQELRRAHPELANAYRFVLLLGDASYHGTQRVRVSHLIMVIEGEGERLVLDTSYGRVRAWSDYDASNQVAATARDGLAGAWTAYR